MPKLVRWTVRMGLAVVGMLTLAVILGTLFSLGPEQALAQAMPAGWIALFIYVTYDVTRSGGKGDVEEPSAEAESSHHAPSS